jgi:hypothetical protein
MIAGLGTPPRPKMAISQPHPACTHPRGPHERMRTAHREHPPMKYQIWLHAPRLVPRRLRRRRKARPREPRRDARPSARRRTHQQSRRSPRRDARGRLAHAAGRGLVAERRSARPYLRERPRPPP